MLYKFINIQQQINKMLKDHFQRSTQTLNNLRSQHFKVSEYLNKGRYRLKQKFFGKGKKHYDFDINSQQFFHEYVDDIIFQPTDIQEIFYNEINKSLESPVFFNNKKKVKDIRITPRKNPSEVRSILARHYRNRSTDLAYKKYRTLLRTHNLNQQQHLGPIKSRTNLLDRQIQQCLSRQSRLQIEDYFQQSYTQGGKPIPVNQNGQPIYKYLDEQDCWFSNIARDDIQCYLRNVLYREAILEDYYWPYFYQFKYVVFSHGLEFCQNVENELVEYLDKVKKEIMSMAKLMIFRLQRGLQQISPGNLIQKQNLTNFVYGITGLLAEAPVSLPLYPATQPQLVQSYNTLLPLFFKSLILTNQRSIIDMLPKLNSFCSIMFKYQNQQILQGQKQIKLGLEDQIDIKKELITMLEEQWVEQFVCIDFSRFQYKLMLKQQDWQYDAYTRKLEEERGRKLEYRYRSDYGLEQLIKTVRLTTYGDFRKILKKRSQKILQRLPLKYQHMQLAQKVNKQPDTSITKQKLTQFYKSTSTQFIQPLPLLKQSTRKYFNLIMKDYFIKNPVQIQIEEMLGCVKIREIRTRIMNILNGYRCYQRGIAYDVRVLGGCEFVYEVDDDFLINSNKQTVQKFQKNIKDNQTMMSKANSHQGMPTLQSQSFLQKSSHTIPSLYKKDTPTLQYFNNTIPHIIVNDGIKKKPILYNIVLEDLKHVQSRILEIGTHFINKYQRYIKMRELPELIDRVAVLAELYQLEERLLWERYLLIQQYYYVFQNTIDTVIAHKIAKIITQIIYEQPKIDLSADNYRSSYQILIQLTRSHKSLLHSFTTSLQSQQSQKNKTFHKKFAQSCQIPLTLWAYIYCDMEVKGAKTYNKLQRMNSVSSKMSHHSKSQKQKNVVNELREQIRQEFGEDSEEMEAGEEEEQFNLETYDEYMLKRNMDDIFQDIVSGGDVPKDGKDKDVLGVSSLGLENLTVNPRFEGGPHALHNYLPDYKITSDHSQKLLNFSEHICYATNIYSLIKQLVQQAKTAYGMCSTEYILRYQLQVVKRMHNILLTPVDRKQKLYEIQTDDVYHQLVTQDMKHFQQIMTPILDLPSALQLSIPTTHQKHQNTLPSIQILSKFDYNILVNLVKLQKPLNSAVYRELNLGINLIEFFRIRDNVWKIQLERQQVYNGYKVLGTYCDIPVDKYTHCYGRTGGSQIFLASSQSKIYNSNYLKHPTFNDSIEQLRIYYQLQQTQLQLFKQCVSLSKKHIQPYIRIIWDIQKPMQNHMINRSSVLMSEEKKNTKMVANRIKGYVSSISGEIYKTKSYLKFKVKLKNQLEDRIRKETQNGQLQAWINKYYLTQNNRKYTSHCTNILADKMKRLIVAKLTQLYTKDIAHNMANISNVNQLLLTIDKIRNYAISLPYLSKVLVLPTEYQNMFKKAFYDQKKMSTIECDNHADENVYYVCSKQQVLQQWLLTSKSSSNHLQKQFQLQQFIKSLAPPKQKQQLFKWLFKIPSNKITQPQKCSLKHLLSLYSVYTGKSSISEYRVLPYTEGTRNKHTELLDKYTVLLEYIQANFMVICLQNDSNVVEQIVWGLDRKINFQQKYPLEDEQSIYPPPKQNSPSSQQPCSSTPTEPQIQRMFLTEDRSPEFTNLLQQRIDGRRYRPELQYFAVGDEILQFLKSKIEGHSVIRHCMRQLRDQMSLFSKVKYETSLSYMRSKSYNTMCMMWLGLWRMLNTKKDKHVGEYVSQFLDLIVDVPKLQILQPHTDRNARRGITNSIPEAIEQLEQQKQKYNQGIYNLKSDFLVNKLKIVYNFLPFNVQSQMENYLHNSENMGKQTVELYGCQHNFSQIEQFKSILMCPTSDFRYSWFAKMREFYILGQEYIETKAQSPTLLQLLELQQKKTPYFQYLIQGKIYMTALTALKVAKFAKQFPQNMDKFWPMFYETMKNNQQIVDINAFNIYDQLQAYKNSGKIIFTKTEQSLCQNQSKSLQSQQHTNKIYRTVIFNKLVCEQFKNQVLQIATHLLKSQKTPKTQGKKIQNTSLIPRVHLISSYSSPLIVERKTYISQQYKLAFVQAFINRFRNKVSRVDLLSSGYGFVITVPDLEDCVNYMNKLLFTFSEKEFKVRLDTFSQYYQILIDGIRSRNQIINQQKAIIKHLQDKVKNTLQAQYLSKVSKLLQQKVLMEQKLMLAEQNSNGLEHRVRKAVQYQYDKKILSLQKQNEELRGKFQQFKQLLIRLTKDSTKNNFLNLVNILKDQTGALLDKKIDLSQSFKAISESQPKKNIKPMIARQQQLKQGVQKQQYDQQDIQRCKIGQAIIHDPYYVTKLINKMRLFNLFKLGAKKLKHEAVDDKKSEELVSLHKIQDRLIVQSERQTILRDQLIKAQEELSKKSVELDKSRHVIQGLENQRAKLKILLVTKQKKIQQKERENQQFKKKIEQKSQVPKLESKQSIEGDKSKIEEQLPRISAVRQTKKTSVRRMPKQPFITTLEQRSGALSLYEKFQLSNKDSTWRQKCEQLYLENKKLLSELEKIKGGVGSAGTSGLATPVTREGYSLNLRNKRTAEESQRDSSRTDKRKFTNLSFKYGVMKG